MAEFVRSRQAVEEVASRVVAALREVLARRPTARLAIAGGSAAAAVGFVRQRLGNDWRRVLLTWVDERQVPYESPDSNRGSAHRKNLLVNADAPAGELPLFLDGESPQAAKDRAEDQLRRDFDGALDVLLLGMGEDGHIASLFPGHPALEAPGLVAVVADSPKPPAGRVTLTLRMLQTAQTAVLLATGEGKRPALERLAADAPSLPVGRLPRVTVVTDLEMSMEKLNDIGMIGLGVMGGNFARNLASKGFRVAGWARDLDAARKLAADHPEAKLTISDDLVGLVRALERPRRIVVLVNAGKPVDDVLAALDPLLDPDDVVVDAGNSLFADTERRLSQWASRPWKFVGMGISGGSEGALKGPAMMPGGDRASYERLKPLLEATAARSDAGPCVTWCGNGSAGHFVKMVHNGIEYGDMQLIAETALLLKEGLALAPDKVAQTFADWNRGELNSYLVEITADILRTPDPEKAGGLLVDAILDQAGQKGTGSWTVVAAAELNVAIPTIAAAVDARNLSAGRNVRLEAAKLLGGGHKPLAGVTIDDLRDALYASKIASYTQGFAMLARGSAQRGYQTDLAEVARIWTSGCIIRARFLQHVREAFSQKPAPELLALAPAFAADLAKREAGWRRVVAAATAAGLPIPGLAASLTWFDTLRTARGSAALIQAQRDYFGSHTYERLDRPGQAIHTDWPRTN